MEADIRIAQIGNRVHRNVRHGFPENDVEHEHIFDRRRAQTGGDCSCACDIQYRSAPGQTYI
jgi:hypothetical protein